MEMNDIPIDPDIEDGKLAGRSARAAKKMAKTVDELVVTVAEHTETIDAALPAIIGTLRFINEDNRVTLVQLSWKLFQPEWAPNPDRQWQRGEVARMGWNKWLSIADNVRIPQGQTPETHSSFLLHRSTASFNPDGTKCGWVREEFVLRGTWRWFDNPQRPQETGWYELLAEVFDGAQTPPQIPNIWAYRGNENPPE